MSAEIESILVFVGLRDIAKSRDDYEPPGVWQPVGFSYQLVLIRI